MTMQFGMWLPQAWNGDFRESRDSVEAYETMTHMVGVQELIVSFFLCTDPEQLHHFARECIV